MFQTRQIAAFSLATRFEDLSYEITNQLKKHLLDSLGSFIHAIRRPTIQKLFKQIKSLNGGGNCEVPVLKRTSLDRAAEIYTALIRYPDFMDNFLGKESTCHPCDNIGSLLAITGAENLSSKDFLTAMAVGYEIECRLIEEIPVMIEGFDHTLLLAFSLTASACKLMHLSEEQTSHALAIAGCSLDPLVTCRSSYTYEWKGLASSFIAFSCINFALLAKEGMTGPVSIFEGPRGYKDIFGMELKYDWKKEDFSLIKKCILKEYNSEVHTQPSIEAVLQLKKENNFLPADIKEVDITTFLTCYHIVGGGEYGDRKNVHSKEQADHSLFYTAAIALLDGQVYPEQLLEERINREDVQELLKKINVHTGFPLHKPLAISGLLDPYTKAYPEKLMIKAEITLNNDKKFSIKKEDYHGFYTRPLSWDHTADKFRRLTKDVITKDQQEEIISLCKDLENDNMHQLLSLLNSIE